MNKKISILHFSQVNGGVERYLKLFLKFSNKEQFTNSIISPQKDNYATHSGLINNFYEVDIDQSFSITKLVKNILNIRQIILKEKPDVLYLHSTFAGVIGRVSALGCKCKVVYNPHGWSFKMNVSLLKTTIYKIIEKTLSLFTDKFILISKSEYNSAKEITNSEKKLALVYNGIDVDLNAVIDLDLNLDNKYVIGMVGRISEQKNPLFFVEFARLICKKYPNTFFIIVGSGEQLDLVEQKIEEYGLSENFLITGWVCNPESYIKLFDQAVLFSKWEGFGFAVAEYMLYKKPIIINDIDGMSELITHFADGVKIQSENLSEALEFSHMIREHSELAEKLGNEAYNTVIKSFSAKDKVQQVESLFIDLVRT